MDANIIDTNAINGNVVVNAVQTVQTTYPQTNDTINYVIQAMTSAFGTLVSYSQIHWVALVLFAAEVIAVQKLLMERYLMLDNILGWGASILLTLIIIFPITTVLLVPELVKLVGG